MWALVPAAVFVAGVVNYFVAGPGASAPGVTAAAQLDYASPELTRIYSSRTVLRLPWGDGDDEVALSVDGGGEPISTLEAVVAEPGGSFMVVDHPSWHIGARVRRYSADGALLEVVLAPPGSTLFTSAGGRLAYVVAKQADDSERLVVRDGSAESTWVVPLSLNSGAIVTIGDDLWVTAVNSEFDTEAMVVTTSDIAVPVVIDGRQATDEEAAAAAIQTWRTAGGRLYGRTQVVEGNGPGARITQTITQLPAGAALEIPGRSTPLGLDAEGRVYVLTEAVDLPDRVRVLPGTLQSRTGADEILVGTLDGAVLGRIVAPGWVPTVGGWTRFGVSEDGSVLAAVSDTGGVSIVRYTAVSADD